MVVGLINAAGAVALLIFGIRFLRKGLDRLFAERLDTWIGRVSSTPLRAMLAGTGLGAVAPSSTGGALLVVSLIHARRLTAECGMAILLGTYVGMTVVIALVSFDISGIAPALLLVGVSLFLGTRRSMARGIGQVALALGLIFLSIGILKGATRPLAGHPDVTTLMEVASRHAWAVAVAGMLLSIALQSSKSTIAVGIGLALSGVIDTRIALALVVGANLGISVTALLAGWGDAESRRMGVGLMVCRVPVAAAALWFAGPIASVLASAPGTLSHHMAMAHTLFNAASAVAFLPLVRPISWAMSRLVLRDEGGDELSAVYLDPSWSGDPAVSFSQTRREIARAGQIVLEMLREWWRAIEQDDELLCARVRERDDLVDRLDADVKVFLTRQISDGLDEAQAEYRIRQLRFSSDLETIADVIDRSLVDVAEKKISRGVRFSPEGWEELRGFHAMVVRNLELAVATFESGDPAIARRLLESKGEVRDREIELRTRHFDRLRTGEASAFETTGLHLEILSQLKHISHIASGVAYAVLEPVSGEQERVARDGRRAREDGAVSGAPGPRVAPGGPGTPTMSH